MIIQNSCHWPPHTTYMWHHLFDPVTSLWHDSGKPPRNSRIGFCCTIWLAHFASFWVDTDHYKASLAKDRKSIRRETAGTTGVGFQKPCHSAFGFVDASWHRPMFCKLFMHKLAFTAILKGGLLMLHVEVCAQILLSDNRDYHACLWACFEKLLLNLHIQPKMIILLHSKIKLLPNHFKVTIIFLIISVIISELSCSYSHIR